jgi:hypothetical protein
VRPSAARSATDHIRAGRPLLGERLNVWQILGSAMIVCSVLVLSWPKRVVADEP